MTLDSKDALADRMAALARQLAVPLSVDEVLAGVTQTVLDVIPGAGVAGFLLFTKAGKFETKAATADLMYEIDRLQIENGEGPCIEAAVDELIVRTDDFRAEERWPNSSVSNAGRIIPRRSSIWVCAVRCRSSCTPVSATRAR